MRTIEMVRATLDGSQTNGSAKRTLPTQVVLEQNTAPAGARASSLHHKLENDDPMRLDEARFWLAAIAESSQDAIIGKSLDGIVTSWNKAAETMFGFTAQEIIGQSINLIVPSDRIDEEAAIISGMALSKKIYRFETQRRRKDGSIIPVSLTVSPIRDDQGRIIGASKTARDLTEMQRMHNDLERREALLRSVLNTVPAALIVIDRQGMIHSFSAAAERLFGYTVAEMIGNNVSTLLPASELGQNNGEDPGTQPIGTHPIGAQPIGEINTLGFGQRKNETTFPMELAIGEVNLADARLFTVFVHDLTDQAERERELRVVNTQLKRLARHLATSRDVADRSNWAKTRFLAGMSHELRTPLNGILGYAQLLRLEGGLNPAQNSRVTSMMEAGKHLLQMITRVLDLSEIEAGHVELRAAEIDVLPVAASCLDQLRPAAEAKNLSLKIDMAPGTPRKLVTDQTRLRQVLLNLLGNAVKFTAQGSIELRLRSAADGSTLRIEVVDTGPGIPVNERRRLFREFERLDGEATRNSEGAGLGLALSARLAILLGGGLGHHDNPAGGSVFWLELPSDSVAVQQAPPAPEETTVAAGPVVLHVLVVDDVAMNRDIASSFLRVAGHKVTCIDSGAEAVAAVATHDFDVVLMDVRMPEMDGLEATRRIRALEGPRGRVPIVALTAQAFTEQVAECRKAGMNSHLPKPFDPDSLLAAVLRASTLERMPDETPEPLKPPAPVAVPVIGSDLQIFNQDAFERTTFYLPSEAVTSYLEAITHRGEALLRGLRVPDALVHSGELLAEAAHTIAGSAGMFGFERLTVVGRRFERAVHAGAAETPALADGLSAALTATLEALHERTLVVEEV
jgi:PAS domain S-box-containing protein